MIKNCWNDDEASECIRRHDEQGYNQDLALRVYTSRLIGSDSKLVMHGGGNTSCKTQMPDVFGDLLKVLCIKGSGWDLSTIEAPGLPPVRLDPLLRLKELAELSDEEMVNVQRANLLDQSSPNPSVETLLHAFLPHSVVDHTHSSAFLALANLPDCNNIIEDLFSGRLAVVPYVMPGFALSKLVMEIYEKHPDIEGLVLEKHGHITWGETAKLSYERVIDQTNTVERWLAENRIKSPPRRHNVDKKNSNEIVDNLKAALFRVTEHKNTSFVFDIIDDIEISGLINNHIANGLDKRGVVTPDHVIRIKALPLVLTREIYECGTEAIESEIQKFISVYKAYFDRWSRNSDVPKVMLEPLPKLVWIEDFGLIGVGGSKKEARVITDLGIQNVLVISDSEQAGGFYPVAGKDLFDMEYWSLEQAKLSKTKPHSMNGKIVLISGAAGGIGQAIVERFSQVKAEVIAIDINGEGLEKLAETSGGRIFTKKVDITNEVQIEELIEIVRCNYGGIDVLISNAGIAPQGSLIDLDLANLRQSFEINFFGHFLLATRVAELMIKQENHGHLLFNISKQAVNPGRNFGAYGIPKAALMSLTKQFALELGGNGIRVNGINADRIRSGILTDEFIKGRAMARGINEESYMTGNLLGQEVKASDVADAFLALACSQATTGHVMTVDGGNIEASLR